MHGARPGEINSPALEQQRPVAPVHVGPAVGRPHRVHDDRVDPRGHEERVEEVGLEASALGDGARDDGAGGGGERPLENPLVVLRGAGGSAFGQLGHAEELRADEAVGGGAVSVGEGVAELVRFFFK